MANFHHQGSEQQKQEQQRMLEEHKLHEQNIKALQQNKRRKKKIVMSSLGGIFLILIALGVYIWTAPGSYDDFAKCLTEKGAIMYGEDWCQYTNAQKGMFGNSFKYVNYQVKTDLVKRPTWVIDGKEYPTVQSFQRLAVLTGCKY